MAVPSAISRQRLRAKLRRQRRELPTGQRSHAENCVARSVISHPWFSRARNVSLYMAFDGELDLARVFESVSAQRKQLFVPQLSGSRQGMRLVEACRSETRMTRNAYGIREPVAARPVDPRSLDLVLVPLVGFDASGTRIGMGGGHYDRLFSFLRSRRIWRHPKLLGIGFELQRQESLPGEAWDVPLHGAITELRRYYFAD